MTPDFLAGMITMLVFLLLVKLALLHTSGYFTFTQRMTRRHDALVRPLAATAVAAGLPAAAARLYAETRLFHEAMAVLPPLPPTEEGEL